MPGDEEALTQLFAQVTSHFPGNLTPHGWYILTTSALTTISDPENVQYLYKFITQQPAYSTPEQRKVLSRRFREIYLKQWVLSGIPRTIMGVLALARAEDPKDADDTLTREGTVMDETNRQRGITFLKMIYGEDLPRIYKLWGSHAADFVWLSENIIYGMFIGEQSMLNTVETELITYASIACQNLGPTARIHLKALRRLGVSHEEAERITECAKMIAEFHNQDTSKWASIKDVETVDGELDEHRPPRYDKNLYSGL